MKIAFITSCLEPHRDGVGDYTTLLAAECERRGHDVRLVSLNDPHVDEIRISSGQLRLSPALSWQTRVENAADLLSLFDPDFVSLQFVCYGFHPRGIDFALASRLREIMGERPVQIMFHELWIGAGKNAPLKERFNGALQRFSVLRLLRSLNVRAVHASNAPYLAMLRGRGVKASYLPLFGAIPAPAGGQVVRSPDGALVFGIFGTLHPVWPPEPLFSYLRRTGRKIAITHIGRMGAGAALWEKLGRDYGNEIEFKSLGEQPPEKIARFFRDEIDFGIATTPWELIGKSASAAAMVEHGVPVIVNRDDWRFAGPGVEPVAVSPLLIKMDESLTDRIFTMRRAAPQSGLPETATRFMESLGQPA